MQLLTIVVLALSTGMRQGEIMGLRWPNVDLQQGWITLLDTKNGESRGVPLGGRALELTKNHAKVRRLDTDLVFPTASGLGDFPRKAWQNALQKAGIQDFHFHDLRHTAASYLLMNGASLGEVADVLGHRTLAMAKRYSHIADDHRRKVVERLNVVMFGNSEKGA